MVFLVDIYAPIHRIGDSTITEHCASVAPVINMTNNNSVISTVDGQIGAVLNLTRGVDVLVDVRRSIKGEDLQFFPIEQIHPTRGTTFSTALELRY